MRISCLFFLLLSISASAQPTPKVVFVIADGIPADVMERLQPPAIRQIIQTGKYSRAYVGGVKGTYKETPTISAPGYNNLLTGVWGNKHNVWNNDNQHPNYNYPSIFRLVKSQKRPLTSAVFSTWLDNRTVLLGEGLPQTGNLAIDYMFDGYEKDTVRFPHDRAAKYIHLIDETVIRAADSVIRLKAPDLSWIYLEYTDDIGHRKGTGSAQDSAIGLLDRQMAKIASAISYREQNFNEKWLLVMTTDHGRDSISGHNHGGQSNRERTTWIVLNKPVTNAYWASGAPGIVDILPSIANFLQIELPDSTKYELDGTPFIGNVSITDAKIERSGDDFTVRWKSLQPSEKVKLSIAYTNGKKEGKTDVYYPVGTVKSGNGQYVLKIPGLAAKPFFKVVVEGRHNTLNAWYLNK
ncbi:alkaline phosphatase family protein [Flavihumibacter fluvii]|uniref:alkaline phosphatase family protein n=1 Tax=Flavihumibacter fluvii TaxID=2838157 RepID=UPI001BDDFD0E|nr:alkaline phosphatase family protein [Flavihumibacter fluvii]ULQ52056.1 alkaline phosphatase family protein [Flavihumibacter fluvii]